MERDDASFLFAGMLLPVARLSVEIAYTMCVDLIYHTFR